jgi:hypothetical protein
MRNRAIGLLAATLSGALLAACGTTAALSPSSTSAPVTARLSATTATHHAGTPVDLGRVRLWLPTGWSLASDPCPMSDTTAACPQEGCPPGGGDVLYVATFSVPAACHGAVRGDGSVWLFPRPVGTGPPTWRALRAGHGSVLVEVPALGVSLYGFSPMGARVAESFGPSPLETLLAARLPTAPPRGWHRISYGSLSVEVPASWPVRLLPGSHYADPGACEFSEFETPVADVGFGPNILFCPLIDSDTVLRANAAPVNGAWLQSEGPSPSDVAGGPSAVAPVQRRVHGLRLVLGVARSLHGSDAMQVAVHHDGQVGELVVGLGRSPLVAEQILSSIELTR